MICDQGNKYTELAATPEGLEQIIREVLLDAKTSFKCKVEYGIATDSLAGVRLAISSQSASNRLFIRNPRPGASGRFIGGNKRVYILSNDEWLSNRHLGILPEWMGAYLHDSGSVLLRFISEASISWCRSVIIHETLHSVSLYSRIWNTAQDLLAKHLMLYEGLTEFLAGYVLLKQHPSCYPEWKISNPQKCQVAYKPATRLFCSFAQFIGVEPLANFYFSTDNDFKKSWSVLEDAIHSVGFSKFSYALDERIAFRENRLRDECVSKIPGFKQIYESPVKASDFSKIPYTVVKS